MVNGSTKSYFKSSRGLRQGDPLSSMLFVIVEEALNALMEKAKHLGSIKDFVIDNADNEATHLQCADDTILVCDAFLVQVCSLSQRSYIAHLLFVGFVDSCEADIGMTVLDDDGLDDQNFATMFSMGFLKRLTNQTMLQFYAVLQLTPHVEKVDKEWVDINVASPNSFHLHCSLYSSLNACPLDKIMPTACN